MDTYEFTLTVTGFDLDDELQNAMLDTLGYVAVVGRTAGMIQVDVEVASETPEAAVSRVIDDLRRLGVATRRVDLDFVNVSEIADRLGKSRETVRLWATGDRRQGFPIPHAIVGDSQVWAWADVYQWAADSGIGVDDYRPIPVAIAEAFTGASSRTVAIARPRWAVQQVVIRRVQTGRISASKSHRNWTLSAVRSAG